PEDAGFQTDLVTDCWYALEHTHDVAGHGVVHVSFWYAHAGAVVQFIRAQLTREGDGVVPLDHTRTAAVVLVGDFADDLLDQVLKCDDAGGAAVFIDDDRELVASGAQFGHEHIEVLRLGNAQRLSREGADRNLSAAFARHRNGGLQMNDAGDVVKIVVIDRKAAVAGATSQLNDILSRVPRRDRVHARTWRHHIIC